MRHRTALPFLDAFLKPTKHIRSGLFLHYMVCNFCEIRKKKKKRRMDSDHRLLTTV
nr:MAG TPA: hypothetical protein [Caudoviricetes sp.]